MKRQRLSRTMVVSAILCLFVWFIYQNRGDYLRLQIHQPLLFLVTGALTILMIGINGLYNLFFFASFKLKLDFSEWFGLSAVNTLGNLLLPMRGGTLSNAVYLKRRFGLSYASFGATMVATYVIVFWTTSVIGGAALLSLETERNAAWQVMLATFAASFAALTGVMFYSGPLPLPKYEWLESVRSVCAAWQRLRRKRALVFAIGALTVANVAIASFVSYLEFRVIGQEVSLFQCVVVSVFSTFSLLVSVTPGSLGIREAFSGTSAALLGISPHYAIAVSLIDRALVAVVAIGIGLYYSNLLMKRIAKPNLTSMSG